jgi:hypothetical protein
MDFTVSRRNTLYYDRTSLNYLNRAKENLRDSWYLSEIRRVQRLSAMQKQYSKRKRARYRNE